jgi:tetratricopeptide (TPR) repeat protein
MTVFAMPKSRRKPLDESSSNENDGVIRSQSDTNRKASPFLLWTLAGLIVLAVLASTYWLRRESNLRNLETQCKVARELEKWDELEQLAVDWGIYAPLNPIPFEHAAVAAYRLGASDRAYGYLSQMPDNGTLESWLLKSEIEYESLNDPLASLESCNRAIRIDSSNSEAHHRLMYFWAMSRQLDQLKTEIERGIEKGASTLVTYTYWFAFDKLRFADAAPVNKSWADIYPEQDTFHIATVLALANLPQFTELQREGDLKILEERFPNNPEVLFTQIERAIERGDDIRVEQLLESKRESLKEDYRYWRSKGWIETERGNYADANSAFEVASKAAPLDWQTKNEWALMLRKQGQDVPQSEELSKLALGGRTLFEQVKRSDSIFSLPSSFYVELGDYYEKCGLKEPANAIRRLVSKTIP